MTNVAVIVVNFNASAMARRAVQSAAADLARGTADGKPIDWTAIVVDNGSLDRGAALDAMPGTAVIVNSRNVGFGAAVNQAVRTTTAPLLWLLNPDCEVVPGAFAALMATLDRHGGCAIAAPRLLNPDGSVQASARGEPGAWTGLFGRNTLLTRVFPSSRLARRNLPAADLVASGVESAPVDWVMGAAMLIRREAFDLVGGFDERYFLYWEDADLCRRLRTRGLETRYVPAARVIHEGGASARTDARESTRAFHRSAYLYYSTHVVPSPWHPARWFARVALSARAWWRARNA
jgi:N-acetylglucosaminyl-diphospho-decaprenol L-rhamnosyltransferase